MSLDGINKKCAGCKQKCKQWKQITVLICPNYAKDEKVHLDQAQN